MGYALKKPSRLINKALFFFNLDGLNIFQKAILSLPLCFKLGMIQSTHAYKRTTRPTESTPSLIPSLDVRFASPIKVLVKQREWQTRQGGHGALFLDAHEKVHKTRDLHA